jgi:hypothetical protein
VLLVTGSHAAYPSFARQVGISHEAVKVSLLPFGRIGGRYSSYYFGER